MTKGFIEDGFIIDLSHAKNAAEIIYELSSILEMPEAQDKKICLKLGGIDLRQSQLLSIKALINSMDSELAFVDTNSEQTELAAVDSDIIVSKLLNEIEIPEIENELTMEETTEEEIEQEAVEVESSEGVDEVIIVNTKLTDELEDEQIEKKEDFELELSKLPTLYLQQTLRSGQTMSYDGNIVLVGDVHPGSEVIAKGDITVWGVLSGIAHAGSRGNNLAKIRALKINAIQLRIAGLYSRRPDTLNIPFIQRTNEFTPEEARVSNNEIAIYKTYN